MSARAAPPEHIVLWRGSAGAQVEGLPPQHVRHSPTGYEWGYGGSGPADLALNILRAFTSEEEADQLYQEFKWDVIASLPRVGGTIEGRAVQAWLEHKRKEIAP